MKTCTTYSCIMPGFGQCLNIVIYRPFYVYITLTKHLKTRDNKQQIPFHHFVSLPPQMKR